MLQPVADDGRVQRLLRAAREDAVGRHARTRCSRSRRSLPWQLFAYALTQSSNSLVGEQAADHKVYFPRLIVPLAAVLRGLVDFAIAFAVLLAMMLCYGIVADGRDADRSRSSSCSPSLTALASGSGSRR